MSNQNRDSRWIGFSIGRAAVHCLAGGLLCGIAGAVLGSIWGTLTEWIINMYWSANFDTAVGSKAGALYGFIAGSLAGAIQFLVAFLLSTSCCSLLPPRDLLVKTLLAMSIATSGAMTSYFLFCAFVAVVKHDPFPVIVWDYVDCIKFVGPTVMVCGQVMVAIWDFRRTKTGS